MGSGVASLESPPHPSSLNILWKWNNLVSVRPNYFIFMGYLRKMRYNKICKVNPIPLKYEFPFQKSWIRLCVYTVAELEKARANQANVLGVGLCSNFFEWLNSLSVGNQNTWIGKVYANQKVTSHSSLIRDNVFAIFSKLFIDLEVLLCMQRKGAIDVDDGPASAC